MTQLQSLEQVFNGLRIYIPLTLKLFSGVAQHLGAEKQEENLAAILIQHFGWITADAQLICKINKGEFIVDFVQFQNICAALLYAPEKVLEGARILESDPENGEQRLTQDLLSEREELSRQVDHEPR